MSGKLIPIPLDQLLKITLGEIKRSRFMGIPGALFHRPLKNDGFRLTRYGIDLETPVGVAAGPHTQLAANIVAAWLCGARYIELKTVQTLDELEVSKPCIDMQDEGYNCEWSQELKMQESFGEYLNAWILIHILKRELGFDGPPGAIFNMSVGYNLEGIMRENVQWFFRKMNDCSEELAQARQLIKPLYPAIDEIVIPAKISDNITLSTMHGCPPGEIEKIGRYLISDKKLHTTIKLNPTLLGKDQLRSLLNDTLGFPAEVPDEAFAHDLKYTDAIRIIETLGTESEELGLSFGVKLTNTLEAVNHRNIFPENEKMMYMSGRALHPISIQVANKLQSDFAGRLDISFSAGIDCFNVSDVLACGLKPATVCSDLLKPGGYGRLWQYIDNLRKEFQAVDARNIDDFILKKAGQPQNGDVRIAMLKNLNEYAGRVASGKAFHRNHFTDPSIKTTRQLEWFDCIHAPCTDTCPTNQDIPEYMHFTACGDNTGAFNTIFRTNPFPSVTGMICDHPCQLKCTRINYDNALKIREIKRFIAERNSRSMPEIQPVSPLPANNHPAKKFAIIGAGPAGLSCAWFLRQAGCAVQIFEQRNITGGMISAAIPAFRLTSGAIDQDIRRILDSGVELHDNFAVTQETFHSILDDHDAVFLAAGAQRSAKLMIEGVDSEDVLDPLKFLFDIKEGNQNPTGRHVVIIGGGNTAMDAARTAFRTVGENGTVTIVYRRTIREMPADLGEIKAVLEEGVSIRELIRPMRIRQENGKVVALVCCKTTLSEKGRDGRPIALDVPGSVFEIPCDTVIPAIGQEIALDFLSKDDLKIISGSYKTAIPKLFIGGDALRGASTAINAIGDGRKAALEMLGNSASKEHHDPWERLSAEEFEALISRKVFRSFGHAPAETPLDQRRNFDLMTSSFTAEEAMNEASRCLQCDVICNVCVSVCPNLANFGFSVGKINYRMQKAVLQEDDSIGFIDTGSFTIAQPFQVLNIRDLCNECGNCTTFCPTSGRPFADKPGLCLSVETLNEEGTGFFLNRQHNRITLVFKEKEAIRTLTLSDGIYTYETDQVVAKINTVDFRLIEVRFLTPCVKEFQFNFAAEMSIVLKGAMQLV